MRVRSLHILLWTKVQNTFQYIQRSELHWGSSISEVWYYEVTERGWSWRDLASTYVLCYYHGLVPNFRDWSIGVWPKYLDQEKTRT